MLIFLTERTYTLLNIQYLVQTYFNSFHCHKNTMIFVSHHSVWLLVCYFYNFNNHERVLAMLCIPFLHQSYSPLIHREKQLRQLQARVMRASPSTADVVSAARSSSTILALPVFSCSIWRRDKLSDIHRPATSSVSYLVIHNTLSTCITASP